MSYVFTGTDFTAQAQYYIMTVYSSNIAFNALCTVKIVTVCCSLLYIFIYS